LSAVTEEADTVLNEVEKQFAGAVVLITGGTGSFGNAFLARLLATEVREIRIFSRDEKKQDDMRHRYRDDRIRYYIGDVRDPDSVADAMRKTDFVFSAAALKQVPSCEFYPLEAVRTNILGTANVIEAAVASGAQRFVGLSTDKAVYPINAMGMSKALMEKVIVAKSRGLPSGATVLCGTRYGNVMASRGSVIPLFIKQILGGKPITITDPQMTRFMMSLEEAVELVLHAFQSGGQGDIFVQKAPAATISDLAETLRSILGGSNEIVVIGTRHGEKQFETLLSREEAARCVDQGRYFRIPADARDLNYGTYFTEGDRVISQATEYTSHNTRRLDRRELRDLLISLEVVRKAREGIIDE
jgi:UDP-N-acetylglucosamine 4,6-dehydratase